LTRVEPVRPTAGTASPHKKNVTCEKTRKQNAVSTKGKGEKGTIRQKASGSENSM